MTRWGRAEQPDASADQERVIALVQANAADVLAYLERRTTTAEDAADILGETLAAAWRRVDDLPDDDTRARMWLFTTARHTLTNHRRGRRRADDLTARLRLEVQAAHRTSTTSHLDPLSDAVRRAIDQLPGTQREVVTLVHWDGFTITEAATVLSVPASTARSQYAGARKNLRRFLQEDSDREPPHARRPQHPVLATIGSRRPPPP